MRSCDHHARRACAAPGEQGSGGRAAALHRRRQRGRLHHARLLGLQARPHAQACVRGVSICARGSAPRHSAAPAPGDSEVDRLCAHTPQAVCLQSLCVRLACSDMPTGNRGPGCLECGSAHAPGPSVLEGSAADTVGLRRDVFSAGASHYGVADCELLAQVWPFALPDFVMALDPCTALLD